MHKIVLALVCLFLVVIAVHSLERSVHQEAEEAVSRGLCSNDQDKTIIEKAKASGAFKPAAQKCGRKCKVDVKCGTECLSKALHISEDCSACFAKDTKALYSLSKLLLQLTKQL